MGKWMNCADGTCFQPLPLAYLRGGPACRLPRRFSGAVGGRSRMNAQCKLGSASATAPPEPQLTPSGCPRPSNSTAVSWASPAYPPLSPPGANNTSCTFRTISPRQPPLLRSRSRGTLKAARRRQSSFWLLKRVRGCFKALWCVSFCLTLTSYPCLV
jgi:hypothetical protein